MRPVPTARPLAPRTALCAVLAAAVLGAACQGQPNTVTIAPEAAGGDTIYGATTTRLIGVVQGANQQNVPTTVVYSSSDQSVASVPGTAIQPSPNIDYPVTVTGSAVTEDKSVTITGTEQAGAQGTKVVVVRPAAVSVTTTGATPRTLTVYPSVTRAGALYVYKYHVVTTAEMRTLIVRFGGPVSGLTVARFVGTPVIGPNVTGSGADWVMSAPAGSSGSAPTDGYTELDVVARSERGPNAGVTFEALLFPIPPGERITLTGVTGPRAP